MSNLIRFLAALAAMTLLAACGDDGGNSQLDGGSEVEGAGEDLLDDSGDLGLDSAPDAVDADPDDDVDAGGGGDASDGGDVDALADLANDLPGDVGEDPDGVDPGDADLGGADDPDVGEDGDADGPDAGRDADAGGDAEGDAGGDADAVTDSDASAGGDADTSLGEDVEDTGGEVLSGLDRRPSNPTCLAADRIQPAHGVEFTRAFGRLGGFDTPILMLQAPGDDSEWFVVENGGRVMRLENSPDVAFATIFIDIRDRVYTGFNEQGLLGMAFAPDFAESGEFYLSYIDRVASQYRTRISRFTLGEDGDGDKDSEVAILTLNQPDWNHNGGHIAFGPDGYLYIGLGDGGGSRDTYGHGQNRNTLLGAMLRIDVSGGGAGYTVPADNPFVGTDGADEIWAWGLRNPWRWSFDRVTGELWAGDVGQNSREEIDLIVRGGNYGWPYREGTICPSWQTAVNCARSGLIEPVTDYGRSLGYSVTGGYVYRGEAIPALYGDYLFGDFGTRNMWAYGVDPTSGESFVEPIGVSPSLIASFAEDLDGELYVVGYDGAIWQITAPDELPVDEFPRLLSETGCVDPEDPTTFTAGVIPYDINVPFWSDGAIKTRYVALPNATFITVGGDGDWTLPIGSVVIKQFEVEGRLIETRLLMRHDDGEWAGYSYVWNEEQTDAELALEGATVELDEGTWEVPSSAECLACHTPAAGSTLALETGQLNRAFRYPSTGRLANQLSTLHEIVYFAGGALGEDPDSYVAYPDSSSDDLEGRARAYLHSNCSHCHRPGAGRTNMDLRYSTPFADTETCGVTPSLGGLGVEDPALVAPGSAARSIIWQRMSRRGDEAQMPPLGSVLVDEGGAELLGDWIDGLASCPE